MKRKEIPISLGFEGGREMVGPNEIETWKKEFYMSEHCYYRIRNLLEQSAQAAQTTPRYPLIDIYVNLYKPTASFEPRMSSDYYEPFRVSQEIYTKIKTTAFPYSLADYIINHFERATTKWYFTDKENPNPGIATAEEQKKEMYFVSALVEFFADGYKESEYKNARADDRATFICEGRLDPATESKVELYEKADLFFKEMFLKRGGKFVHPLSIDEYTLLKKMKGESAKHKWFYRMNELVEVFNENLYAMELAGKRWKQIQIGEDIGAEGETVDAYLQWIIYCLVCDYFQESHAKSFNYNETRAGLARIEGLLSKTLNNKVLGETFVESISEARDLIERVRSEDHVLKKSEKRKLVEAKDFINAVKRRLETRTKELQDELENTLRYRNMDHYINYKKLSMSSMQSKAMTKLMTLARLGFVEMEEDVQKKLEEEEKKEEKKEAETITSTRGPQQIKESEIPLIAERAHTFIRTLLEPLDYLLISYSILTFALIKYVEFLERVCRTCAAIELLQTRD